jgi:hypothetical protein
MYRFDDKRRRQLLEDALVADLLDVHANSTGRPSPGSTPVAPSSAPVAEASGPKRSA